MILLTDNRNKRGKDSLEQTLREENQPTSLPVLTIGKVERITEQEYRSRCVTRLADILSELENYLGPAAFLIHKIAKTAVFPPPFLYYRQRDGKTAENKNSPGKTWAD